MRLQKLVLSGGCALVLVLSGCVSAPPSAPPTPLRPPEPLPPPEPAGVAKIRGAEESSLLLDNFTAFVTAVDGVPVAAGRKGWSTPLEIKAGRRTLTVAFIRGVFSARADLELEAAADASYELRFTTDAQLFGHNSFCNFWVVDLGTGQTVSPITKAPVKRNP